MEKVYNTVRVQKLCESWGGRPGLSVLTSLKVSVDIKQHWTMLRHWPQFVPDMSTDIRGHEALHHHHSTQWAQQWSEEGGRAGLHSELDHRLLQNSTAGCPDSIFVILFRAAVERASCRGCKLLRMCGDGSQLLNIYCSGGGWWSLRSLWVRALGTSYL